MQNIVTSAVALAIGLVIGYIDLHSTEVQFPALLILVGGFVFGFIQPRGAWRWGVSLGLGVPLAHLIGSFFNLLPPFQTEIFGLIGLPLIFALAAVYAGSLLRSIAAPRWREKQSRE
jgi:hypothetical protein